MSERDGWNHLYIYDLGTGQVKRQLTKGEWVVRGIEKVDEDRKEAILRVNGLIPGQDPYHIHYAKVSLDTGKLTPLTDGDGTHIARFSPDGQYFVDTYSRVDAAPIHELRRTSDGKKVLTLETADWTAWQAAGGKAPERFVAKGRDGKTDIYGLIFRPTNFDRSKTYPVIENIYAGPHGQHVPKAFSEVHGSQEMAELGFIVVQIDGMGTNWRSKAFHDVCWKNIADAGFPDRIAWLKAAGAKYHELDLNRVGIYGTSAGGQNALHGLLLHGDFYKAGVADSGCLDNRMDKVWWNEQWMGWPLDKHYAEQSCVVLAPKLTGKLFLMVGQEDTNVDPSTTFQMVDALIRADKDFELLVAPNVGHGVVGIPYARRRMQDFFVKNLMGVEPRR
ncbi:MAG: prolyl oligopeptidase family serine peptidase [Armatimonas sp.]